MERLDAHTPMMQRYPHYKERHPDNLLFCRMGDSNEQLHDAAEHAQQHHGD